MKNYRLTYVTLCITALLLVTSCSKEDLTSAISESTVTQSQPSFDQTAVKLSEILLIAKENNWFDQSDLITGLMKPDRSFTPAEIDDLELNLGIPYNELNRLLTELGTATNEYLTALIELNLSGEDQARMIHDAVSTSVPMELFRNNMIDEQGRCFLRSLCYLIGDFLVEVYINLFCDSLSCEEEVLPLIILVQSICEWFSLLC